MLKYKKVPLHERKRHTDHGLSSTPYAVLSRGGGTLAGGGIGSLGYPLPHWTWLRGVGTLAGGVRYIRVPPPPVRPGWGVRYLGQGVGTLRYYLLPPSDLAEGGGKYLGWE